MSEWIKLQNGGLWFSRNMDAYNMEIKTPNETIPELKALQKEYRSLVDKITEIVYNPQFSEIGNKNDMYFEKTPKVLAYMSDTNLIDQFKELNSLDTRLTEVEKRRDIIQNDNSIPEIIVFRELLAKKKELEKETFILKGLSKPGTVILMEDGTKHLIGHSDPYGLTSSCCDGYLEGKVVAYKTLPLEELLA